MVGRLQHLEKMGLAAPAAPQEWMVGLEAERSLRDLGMRGDIIETVHRAFAERGEARGVADFIIEGGQPTFQIVGRLVDRGLHDELTGEAYALIDGTDGRAHHVCFRGLEAFEHAPPVGGIVEVRRLGQAGDPRPTVVLTTRSDLDLGGQVTAKGATWLDYRLVERDPIPLAMGGFGRETRDAMEARTEHLIQQGLARRQGQRIILQHDLLDTLRRRELDEVAAKVSVGTGLPRVNAASGEHVAGTYRQRLTLIGTLRHIDNGLGFQLVPWSRELEKRLGQHVTGVVKDGGGIEWGFSRKRDLAAHRPSFGRGCTCRSYSKEVSPDLSTFRTVFRDTFRSRASRPSPENSAQSDPSRVP
jgi:hypothetical protein